MPVPQSVLLWHSNSGSDGDNDGDDDDSDDSNNGDGDGVIIRAVTVALTTIVVKAMTAIMY